MSDDSASKKKNHICGYTLHKIALKSTQLSIYFVSSVTQKLELARTKTENGYDWIHSRRSLSLNLMRSDYHYMEIRTK